MNASRKEPPDDSHSKQYVLIPHINVGLNAQTMPQNNRCGAGADNVCKLRAQEDDGREGGQRQADMC